MPDAFEFAVVGVREPCAELAAHLDDRDRAVGRAGIDRPPTEALDAALLKVSGPR